MKFVYFISLLILLSKNILAKKYTICYSSDCNFVANQDPFSNALLFKDVMKQIENDGGGEVHIKEGLYILSTFTEIPSNILLRGDGMTKTILKLMDKAPSFIINGREQSGFIRTRFTKNIEIRDLTLDGNKINQLKGEEYLYGRFGLYTEVSENVHVEHVRIQNFQGYGFDPHGNKQDRNNPKYGNNITITRCIAINNDWDGFTLDQSYNYNITYNFAINNGRHGYNFVTGTQRSLAYRNIGYNNGWYFYIPGRGCGLNIVNNQNFGTGDIKVIDNYLIDSKSAGICLNDVFKITLKDNTIKQVQDLNFNNPYMCVYFELIRDTIVENTKCPKNSIFDTRRTNTTTIRFNNNIFI